MELSRRFINIVSIFLSADAERSKEEMEPEQCNASTKAQHAKREGGNCSLEISNSNRIDLGKFR